MSDPTGTDTETLAEVIAADFGGPGHIASLVLASDWLAGYTARVRAEEREGWASWLETWLGAVGPERPTPEAILRWLRADSRPFGVATPAPSVETRDDH